MDLSVGIIERFAGGLFLVVITIWAGSYLYTRFAGGQMKGGRSVIKVISTMPLGSKKSITIVNIAGEYLVLGVTADNVSFLTKIDDTETIKSLEMDRVRRDAFTLKVFNSKALNRITKTHKRPEGLKR